ncbi:MAG TPA: GNAT family N-acetyltransferase [Caulobacteraceae bacterium]|jgi:CelD/BcsL family acetyltransferase involved in cellulose biosynthesis
MLQAEVLHPSALGDAELAAWRAWCAATPAFDSPLLGPEFARLMEQVREDARVAVFRRGGQLAGFLAHHRRPDGFARPIGATFSDYHALIAPPGAKLDIGEALAAARISAFRYCAVIDPQGVFAASSQPAEPGWRIVVGPDAEAYRERIRAANPKRYKNFRRLQSKLEREVGPIEVTPRDSDKAAFEQLLAWKREQYRATGLHDTLRTEWAQRLMRQAFAQRTGELRGVMTTLRAGGRLVAGHFGITCRGVWHGWISAYDAEVCACGPGVVLMLQLPDIVRALGVETYDMAPWHAHYKSPFATGTVATGEGLVTASSTAGRAAALCEGAWEVAGAARRPILSRLRRRLDHIAAVELSAAGRMLGVAEALAGYARRSSSRKEAGEDARQEA